MFSPNDILTLSKAGFTAQQIAGLSMIANQPTTPVVQQTVPAPAVPAPVVPAPAVPAPAPAVDQVLAELQKLTGLMQNGNIVGSNMPQPQTPEEILAEIINPPIKKE
jgi:hypothetical protein